MAELADLFADDSPPRPAPPRRSLSPAVYSPLSPPRRNNTLFLSPGATPGATPRRRRFDEIDDGFEDGPVSPSLRRGYGVGDREREPEREREITPMDFDGLDRLHSRMANGNGTSAERRDIFDDPFAVQDPLAAGGPDAEPPKAKRHVATVNRDRLVGPHGFPALIKIAKKWKPKGKGHEARDLDRLLNMYQMWAHTMFPKGQFMYTVGRVETLGRQRAVTSYVNGMRDAFHNPEGARDSYDFDPENDPDAEADGEALEAENRTHGITVVGSNGVTSAPQPLFDPTDDFDFADDMAALEEMERGPPPMDEDEDELAAMAEMERGGDDDEIAAMEEMEREREREREDEHARREAATNAAAARVASAPEEPAEDEFEGLYD